jgi:peptide/nickel transport system substrate-binding protein
MGLARTGLRGRLSLPGGVAAAAAIVLCLPVIAYSASSRHGSAAQQSATTGGTAYFAEGAQAAPNYIFPFMSLAFFSVTNISDFQQLMYRPVYWFGQGSQPTLNPSISLASVPKYSKGNTVATFTLKPYKWSNGETVTAQDVVFWMNLLKVEKLGWAAYAAGGMPDDVKSITTSGSKVTITLTGPSSRGSRSSRRSGVRRAWPIS